MGRKPRIDPAEIAEILRVLPDRPEDLTQRDILWSDENIEDVGPNYLIYERYPVEAHGMELQQTMSPEDWDRYDRETKVTWGAHCTCTFCGQEIETLWERRDGRIRLLRGEADADGWKLDREGFYVEKGEQVTCDCCGRWLYVEPKSFLRSGRVAQQVTVSVEAHGGYGCLIYWMQRYELDKNGGASFWVLPREALVVSRSGQLLRFTHVGYCGFGESWKPDWEYKPYNPPTRRLYDIPYASGDTGRHGRVCKELKWLGVFGDYDELEQSTWEKTGLVEFLREEDWAYEDPGSAEDYLRLWQKHPNVENLAKAGWRQMCYDAVNGRELGLIRWEKVKPHEMLGMSKEDFRGAGPAGWGADRHRQWLQYSAEYPGTRAETFRNASFRYRACFDSLMDRADGSSRWRLEKLSSYLGKLGLDNAEGLQLLMDYRTMAEECNALHTERDWWPKNLRAMHDAAAESAKEIDSDHGKEFTAIAQELAGLRWSDGRYCIRVAASAEELRREGKVLHHCVGGYASRHAKRTDVIFFVRKARRPERSWLTLDIRMDSYYPQEVQLHGYYNEHAPGAPDTPWSTKTWKIPRAAREFIDRWKKEILAPWYKAYVERITGAAEAKKKGRKTA